MLELEDKCLAVFRNLVVMRLLRLLMELPLTLPPGGVIAGNSYLTSVPSPPPCDTASGSAVALNAKGNSTAVAEVLATPSSNVADGG